MWDTRLTCRSRRRRWIIDGVTSCELPGAFRMHAPDAWVVEDVGPDPVNAGDHRLVVRARVGGAALVRITVHLTQNPEIVRMGATNLLVDLAVTSGYGQAETGILRSESNAELCLSRYQSYDDEDCFDAIFVLADRGLHASVRVGPGQPAVYAQAEAMVRSITPVRR
jgi:hypothetical protein